MAIFVCSLFVPERLSAAILITLNHPPQVSHCDRSRPRLVFVMRLGLPFIICFVLCVSYL